AAYNLSNKTLTLSQLTKELQSYELMSNDGQSVRKVEANILLLLPQKGRENTLRKVRLERNKGWFIF
ncbi:hypothetical protein J1N35_018840, partial [Gossypium stocksii]